MLVMVISPDMILEVASQPEMPQALPNTAPAHMDQHSLLKVLPFLSVYQQRIACSRLPWGKKMKCVALGRAGLFAEEHRQA